MAFEIGQRVGDYEIVQLLGIGGMGHVYRVRNVISDRTEAMKVLLPDLTAERDLAIRFISEIRTLASFDHPNIALLHTAFQSGNQLIMMMEFVEGATLEQRARQSPMSIPEVCGYTYQALSALSYAHGRGVVHRDIKPANIMLTSHGIVKLMDFGIAKSKVETNLTRPGTTIGSLYYMSPEQVRGDTVDGRSDLYSVGIMLYELLAGRRPFEAETTFSILNQQLNTPPQPPIELNPSLPRALNDLILHALAKSPADRYQTADNFRDALRPFCPNQTAEPGHMATIAAPFEAAVTIAPFQSSKAESANPPSSATAISGSATPPPPFANVVTPQPAQFPPQQPKSHKTLWIATGVAAAVLAMIGLAIGVPHFLGTRAATANDQTSSQPASPNTPSLPAAAGDPSASLPSQPVGQTPQQDPGNTGVNPQPYPGQPTGYGSPNSAGAAGSPHRPAYTAQGSTNGGKQLGSNQTGASPQPDTSAVSSNTAASSADLEQARDRFTEVSARAGAVDSSLAGLRRQQEAEGYGLRGDMASADNRLQSYLRAADQDLRSANAASAAKNLNRAEIELATLEKFLGR